MSATLRTPQTAAPVIGLVKPTNPIIPLKVGWFGPQGCGKTTSAALFALALSVLYHNRAPVFVTDTEPGWQFLRRLFAIEGVELIQRTTPTFKAMLNDIREAEKLGACVYAVDSLTIMWTELMQSFKKKNGGKIPINVWGDIKQMWSEYTTLFLNSPMHAFALGRLGNVMEEIESESNPNDTKLVKTGTQFKAGGGESFGYEPHLLLEMSTERKARKKAGHVREGEGRILHRVDVMKDRTWALNGNVIRWSDKSSYEKGGYSTVFQSLKPHFEAVQATLVNPVLGVGQDSTSLISDNGNGEYWRNRKRRDVLVAEIHAGMELLFGGSAKADKQMRLRVFEHIFGFRSKEAADEASLETIERGARILKAFEAHATANPELLKQEEKVILSVLDLEIVRFDDGLVEGSDDLPF